MSEWLRIPLGLAGAVGVGLVVAPLVGVPAWVLIGGLVILYLVAVVGDHFSPDTPTG